MITIIPAIDLIDGKCVRLTRGDYSTKKIYNEDPLEVAKQFGDAGITRLHLVDLDGAKAKKIVNWRVLEKLSARTDLNIDFGGGIQSDEDIRLAFESGAAQITGGSIAVNQPDAVEKWIRRYGAERIILGADCKSRKIAISGWQEGTEIDVIEFVGKYEQRGIRHVISTDVDKDGALTGPAFELYQDLKTDFPQMFIIASGGISKIDDVHRLNEMQTDGVIIGKAIYEQKISLEELKPFLC